MNDNEYKMRDQIVKDICLALNLDPSHPPTDLSPDDAAIAVSATKGTLAVWRSTGRYNLPYFKIGSKVRYRISDIADWKLKRLVLNPNG